MFLSICPHIISVTGLTIEPQNVAVTVVGEDDAGNPIVSFYIQLGEESFLSVRSLKPCVEVDVNGV